MQPGRADLFSLHRTNGLAAIIAGAPSARSALREPRSTFGHSVTFPEQQPLSHDYARFSIGGLIQVKSFVQGTYRQFHVLLVDDN